MSGLKRAHLPLLIRPARTADREAILAFSRQTWAWGDYLEYVWDEWLAASDGRLLVGEVDGQPIAVGRARLVAPGQGWLEGLRVHPAVRQAGVGGAMTRATLGAASELGAEVVRFATRADTLPVHRIAERLGFTRTASYSVLAAPALEDGDAPAIALVAGHEELAWQMLSASTNTLSWRSWHCLALDRTELHGRIASGEAFELAEDGREDSVVSAIAFAVSAQEDRELVVDLMAASGPADLCRLGHSLRRLAASHSLDRVQVKILEDAALVDALGESGYSPTGELDVPFWIFEWRAAPKTSTALGGRQDRRGV